MYVDTYIRDCINHLSEELYGFIRLEDGRATEYTYYRYIYFYVDVYLQKRPYSIFLDHHYKIKSVNTNNVTQLMEDESKYYTNRSVILCYIT